MSFSVRIYHPAVREQVSQGAELDGFEHPPLHEPAVRAFLEKLPEYGYQLEKRSALCKEFVKNVGECPVQVAVFKTEIAFSVPYWKDSEEAIFEALQDSAELCQEEHMVTFNQQDGEWGP